uniref:NDUFA5 n=1 Tax=Euglena gracilis TaxID=3039 RepID=UPI002FE4FB01|eukprot:EG_transcript_24541
MLRAGLRCASAAAVIGRRGYATKVKDFTGLAGYPVEPKWRGKLLALYAETLEAVQGIPADHPYRRSVENLTRHYARVVEEAEDYEVVETTVGLGQVEQLIRMATNELQLVRDFTVWRTWEIDERVLDKMDVDLRTSIGGHYTKRAYEVLDEVEDERRLLEKLQQEVDLEKARVAAKAAEGPKTL